MVAPTMVAHARLARQHAHIPAAQQQRRGLLLLGGTPNEEDRVAAQAHRHDGSRGVPLHVVLDMVWEAVQHSSAAFSVET